MTSESNQHLEGTGISTRAIHTVLEETWDSGLPLVPPITHTATYRMPKEGDPKYVYTRYGNPSLRTLETILANIEGAKHGICFNTGMAGFTCLVNAILRQGDHIIAGKKIYGGVRDMCANYLPNIGIEVDLMDGDDMDEFRKALKPNTKLVWFEPCTNPTCSLVDVKTIAEIAHQYNKDIIVATDNTFLTPYVLKPLELGLDLVFHSLSKYLNGHSDVLGGTLLTNDDNLAQKIKNTQKCRGLTPSSFDCALVMRALQTFELRMQRHESNALKVAQFLESHPNIERVRHPLLPSHPQSELAKRMLKGKYCGMMSVYLKGTGSDTSKFLNSIRLVLKAPSLGGTHSVANQPVALSHVDLSQKEREEVDILDNMIRFSVGLENPEDIINDLDRALKETFQ